MQDLENDRTWSKVRKGKYQQTAKETNEISEIILHLLVLWRIVYHLYYDVHENLVTMAILHGLRQGGSEMYLHHRIVSDKDQRYCTSQVLFKIQIK